MGETLIEKTPVGNTANLSVSSNGSTWVKQVALGAPQGCRGPFSILERIDVGETSRNPKTGGRWAAFSILERIDVGETHNKPGGPGKPSGFQYPRTDRRG